MKVNILDAHDRLLHYSKQADYISQGCAECIANRPREFKNHPFYIFAHARTDDDGVTKRLIWQPRLTKPNAQSNSMLFKCYPPGDNIKIIWIIPAMEMWKQYQKDLLLENKIISESIHDFKNNRGKLECREDDDLQQYQVEDIYAEMSRNANYRKSHSMLKTLEGPSAFYDQVIQSPHPLVDGQS